MCLTLSDPEWLETRAAASTSVSPGRPTEECRRGRATATSRRHRTALQGPAVCAKRQSSPAELHAIPNTIPFDLTFVDRDDTVDTSPGRERIFARARPRAKGAVLPSAFERAHRRGDLELPLGAAGARELLIDARALRDDRVFRGARRQGYPAARGEWDLTEKRALTGERRLLEWQNGSGAAGRAASD
jgi:hypothetical protein